MADLARANVTIHEALSYGGITGKARKKIRASFTGVTVGGATNKIVPAAFGLRQFIGCSNLSISVGGTLKVYPAAVTFAAIPGASTYITLSNPNEAVDANRANAADLATGADVAYITVEGFE